MNIPQKKLFSKVCALWCSCMGSCSCTLLHELISCKFVLLLHLKKVEPLNKQFIIIFQYTDLSVHSIWENTLKMLWTCEGRHLETLVAALYSTLFPSYFSDVQALDRWSSGEWWSLCGKEKKGKKKPQKSPHSQQLFKLELQPVVPNSVPLGSYKLMKCSN